MRLGRLTWVCGMWCLAGTALAQDAVALPQDLSFGAMLRQADGVVKSVMAVLLLASVATLSIWFFKVWELLARRRAIAAALSALVDAPSLEGMAPLSDPASQQMVELAQKELARYPQTAWRGFSEGIKERVAALIVRVEAGEQRKLSRGVSVLGSIGASAPFIGLFGTVWGIMNAFIGIAKTQTTSLAVVAPGIAEALLTTAIGLVAAIPAVLVYNAVTRAIGGYRVRMNDASTQVMCLLSRQLEQGPSGQAHGL